MLYELFPAIIHDLMLVLNFLYLYHIQFGRGVFTTEVHLDFYSPSPNTHSWLKIKKSVNPCSGSMTKTVESLLIIVTFPTNFLTIFLLNSLVIIWLKWLNIKIILHIFVTFSFLYLIPYLVNFLNNILKNVTKMDSHH